MFRMYAHRRVTGALSLVAALASAALMAAPAQAATRSPLWVWGPGPTGVTEDAAAPVPVHGLGPAPVKQVVRNPIGAALVLLTDGTVWAAGPPPLGNGQTGYSATFVQVTALSGIDEIAFSTLDAGETGDNTYYALRADGTVWAWGYGADGELGDGNTADTTKPVPVTGLTGVTSIAAGMGAGYAVTGTGRVWAWGTGTDGQLGNGASVNSDVPVPVSLADRATQLVSQCQTAYALTGGHRIFAWGANGHGQLGDGSVANAATPVLVRGVHDASTVVAGCVDAYAIIGGTGTVMAWGAGAQGEMGDGHTATRLYPVAVTGLTGIKSVSTSYTSAYAVDATGQAWAWGYGRQGNLGDGQNANSSVPVKVINITEPVTAVVPGQFPLPGNGFVSGRVGVVVARGSDGSLWSWGRVGFGALGSGGSGADPGRIPRIPPVTGPFGTWFGTVS
jgi:alpha-tubulin suppressor-like RCC1 family protein